MKLFKSIKCLLDYSIPRRVLSSWIYECISGWYTLRPVWINTSKMFLESYESSNFLEYVTSQKIHYGQNQTSKSNFFSKFLLFQMKVADCCGQMIMSRPFIHRCGFVSWSCVTSFQYTTDSSLNPYSAKSWK